MQAVVYVKKTGEILNVITSDGVSGLSHYATAEKGVLSIPTGTVMQVDNRWVDAGVVKVAAKVVPIASTKLAGVGEDVTISGLPVPCWILNTFTNDTLKITTGSYTFSSPENGMVAIRLQGQYYGEVVVTFDSLLATKDDAKGRIDAEAEAARSRVVTPGSGQAMTYLRKAEAAYAFLNGQPLSTAQTQRLEDEAARLNITVTAAAQTLADTATLWENIDAAIDNTRLVAKQTIDAATTGAQIDVVMKGLDWPV